ncbi:MAG: PH domain-containing protein [Micrococcales bacterium]|nr:PH domain-containing protein [Micrococcales bacterium]
MHPVTPVVRGWKLLVAVLAVLGFQGGEDMFGVVTRGDVGGVLALLGVLVVFAILGFCWALLAWRMTRFVVTDDAVHLRHGILFRSQRRARLDRLQAVDVVRPLLARMFGLSELRLEVAGGGDSGVSLAFLKEKEADRLRAELLALAAGLRRPASTSDQVLGDQVLGDQARESEVREGQAGDDRGFAAAPERHLYTVPLGRLVGSIALSSTPVTLVVASVAMVVAVLVSGRLGILVGFFPVLFITVASIWSQLNGGAFFRAATSPDGIRLRHGLTESRAQTVPPGRVQAVSIHQGPLWRGQDWWRVRMNVAGYGLSSDGVERESTLNPVATRDEVATALWLVLPDLGVPDPVATIAAALTGTETDGGFVPAPRRAVWVDPLGWRRRGVLVTRRALILRSGRWWRRVVVVPHERTQSLALYQGPVQRALRLASVFPHSTPGPVTPVVSHLDERVAASLMDEQAVRARQARATAGPEQWMRRPEVS